MKLFFVGAALLISVLSTDAQGYFANYNPQVPEPRPHSFPGLSQASSSRPQGFPNPPFPTPNFLKNLGNWKRNGCRRRHRQRGGPRSFSFDPLNNPAPSQDFHGPPQGFPSPSQGYASPPKGFPSPSQGYASPPKGFPSPPQGYASPPQGYASPPKGVSSPTQGVSSPPKGVPSPSQGVSGPIQGYDSPVQGYYDFLQGYMGLPQDYFGPSRDSPVAGTTQQSSPF